MSARIRVDKRPGFWRWECLDRTPGSHTWANRSDSDVRWSQSEALQSGLAHLRDHHPETVYERDTTPNWELLRKLRKHSPRVIRTVTSITRCTCADQPRTSYPYFTPCPVHSWLENSPNASDAPTVGIYCRAHGTHRDACGCGVAHRSPDALVVAPGRAGEARTGDCGPLDQAHNQGSRR